MNKKYMDDADYWKSLYQRKGCYDCQTGYCGQHIAQTSEEDGPPSRCEICATGFGCPSHPMDKLCQ